jgi:hypothetical protein
MTSEAMEARQAAYDRAVEALHRVNPKLKPVAEPDEVFAIPRVSEQARRAVEPKPLPPSSEARLYARASAMQNSVAELVARAKRLGIKAELPKIEGNDPLEQLQRLNAAHDRIEKQLEYVASTTKEQRRIDELWRWNQRLEKRVDALASAMSAIAELLPHLLPKGRK